MKKIVLLTLLTGFVFLDDKDTELESVDLNVKKSNKQKYFLIPFDLNTSKFGFAYGVEDKCELTFDFDFEPTIGYNHEDKLPRSRSDNFFTYDSESNSWTETVWNSEYYRVTERDYDPKFTLRLDVGFKKFFKTVETKNYKRSMFIHSALDFYYYKSKYSTKYIDTGYEQTIDLPDNPVDGDVYGDVWVDEDILYSSYSRDIDTFSSSLIFKLGYRFDTKKELFNLPNVSLSLDMILASLSFSYNKSSTETIDRDVINSSLTEYDEDTSINNSGESNIFLDGPSFNLWLKYSL